ncbi:hypothetical protein [Bradyrhizobium prioriisuperbiae]|uniref:hypothetical protein n=1 Tax=Bradyrhizobium prioriisuperbiae TaxID=2854389 RepID=UPI0028E79A07|nr:hypothetical protein [Bradyrhizobium prioritasuperba]
MRTLIPTRRAALMVTCFALAAAVASGGTAFAQAKKDAPKQAAPAAAPAAAPPAAAQEQAPELKQMALTDKQIEGVLASQKEMDAITDKIPEAQADKPNPKVQAQLDGVAKKYGFASYLEYSDVVDNISLVLSGIDPKTKEFLQPPEALKKQIAALQADTKTPAKDKKAALEDMNEALKSTPTVQFPDNVALVTKNYDKLSAALQED